jgi:hypothetical protein
VAKFTTSVKIEVKHTFKRFQIGAKKAFREARTEAKKSEFVFRQVTKSVDKMSASAKKLGRNLAVGAVAGFSASVLAGSKYQTALQDLSALTGLVGNELDSMGKRALESSKKFGLSAGAILETNKIIASQLPALLKQPKLLARVTDETLILAKASRMSATDTAGSLTTLINQFNLTGEAAGRVSNALAAGAKEGSANIEFLARSIEKAGTTFQLMGLDVEDAVALVETIGPKFENAALAGNTLDKAFLIMREKSIGLKDGVFDVNTAIGQLNDFVKAGGSIAEEFGREHTKVIEVLIQGQGEFNRYRDAVTGTNEAQIQADKNMRTFMEAVNRLRTAVEENLIKAFLKMEPTLTKIINGMSAFFRNEQKVNKAIKIAKVILIGLVSAIAAVTAAQLALNIAMTANPIGLIIVGIAAGIALIGTAIGAIIVFWDDIVAASKNAVVNIISFFTNTAFGRALLVPFWPIIKVIKLITAGIRKIQAFRRRKDESLDEVAMEIESFNPADINLDQTSAVKIEMDISQEGSPKVKSVESNGNVDFAANVGLMVPAI